MILLCPPFDRVDLAAFRYFWCLVLKMFCWKLTMGCCCQWRYSWNPMMIDCVCDVQYFSPCWTGATLYFIALASKYSFSSDIAQSYSCQTIQKPDSLQPIKGTNWVHLSSCQNSSPFWTTWSSRLPKPRSLSLSSITQCSIIKSSHEEEDPSFFKCKIRPQDAFYPLGRFSTGISFQSIQKSSQLPEKVLTTLFVNSLYFHDDDDNDDKTKLPHITRKLVDRWWSKNDDKATTKVTNDCK